ncbi:enolase-phosphatase E1 isoform X2 [Armigeres subalbatus]|uniref:enolase-phosphatase E1 isoform X2 n=1 Tax=Armigeres subalbatus TaxID=124917 RepID=UPI002ED30016
MVIKVYISGMSGSKEVKKRQQRVSMILDSKHISYTIVDITEPGQEAEKDFMQKNSEHNGATISDQNPRHPLPPQMFNDAEYCGDYDDFDLANEVDNLEVFLKIEAPKPASEVSEAQQKNGTGDAEQDQVTAATAEASAEDDDNKENKTEEGANEKTNDETIANEELDDVGKQQDSETGVDAEKTRETEDNHNSDLSVTAEETADTSCSDQAVPVDKNEEEDEGDSREINKEVMMVDEELPVQKFDESVLSQPIEEIEQVEITPEVEKFGEENDPSHQEISQEGTCDDQEQTDNQITKQTNNENEQMPTAISTGSRERSEEPMIIDEDIRKSEEVNNEIMHNIKEDTVVKPEEEIIETEQPSYEGEEASKDEATEPQVKVESAKDPPPENDEIENNTPEFEVGDDEEEEEDDSDSDEPVSVMEVTKETKEDETESQAVVPLAGDDTDYETIAAKEISSDIHHDDDDVAEQRELLETVDAMGEREDADENVDQQTTEEDVEIADEDDVSGKLGDTDEHMSVEQEQEE